jgi:hypothetical protein
MCWTTHHPHANHSYQDPLKVLRCVGPHIILCSASRSSRARRVGWEWSRSESEKRRNGVDLSREMDRVHSFRTARNLGELGAWEQEQN